MTNTTYLINFFVSHFVFVLGLSWGWRFNGFGLRLPGALWCKHSKYLQTHTQVVLFAAKNVIERYLWNGLGRECLKAMKALYVLYAKYENVFIEKLTLVEKAKSLI